MNIEQLRRLEQTVSTSDQIKKTLDYLVDGMKAFLRPGECVMLCFDNYGKDTIADLIIRAAVQLGAVPVTLNGDVRWKNILQVAFRSKASVLVGPPFVVLGLSKMAYNTKTPLYFRHVFTAGYRCTDWMIDGLKIGLDCKPWGVFGPGSGSMVGGMSCGHSAGFHIRDDVFDFEIVDENDKPVADGELGYIVITPKHEPSVRFHTDERAYMVRTACSCGRTSPQLLGICSGADVDHEEEKLGRELMSWTSVLDCRFRRGRHGLEIELVTFPGEKLPVLPECGGRVIRSWNPEKDEPYWFTPKWRKLQENG